MTRPTTFGVLAILALCLAPCRGRASTADLASADTLLRVRALDGELAVTSLRQRGSDWDWVPSEAAAIGLPTAAYHDGQALPIAWKLADTRRAGTERVAFTFRCSQPALELQSVWQAARGSGPVEHTLTVINHGTQALLLPMTPSLRFGLQAPVGHALTHWWVEKGAGHPSDLGTHHDAIANDYHRTLRSRPYSGDGADRDAIPWTAMQDETAHAGWYAGIESSGRVRLTLQASPPAAGWNVELGMDAGTAESDRTRLLPGETWQAPTVFVGCYAGEMDDGANRLHRWVERALRPPVGDPRYPLLTLNSWGNGMAVDETLAGRMMDDAVALGLEMFHIDAGWFHAVGDWRENPAKFPHGLAAIADTAHAKGLKFGLWVGWTQGGIDADAENRQSILNVFAPDRRGWFTRDYPSSWKPADFTGADLCLADPAADDWCLALLDGLVRGFHLDMLEHDQRMIVDSCSRSDHRHTASPADIADHAARGYYRVYDALRAKHPGLLFEDCVNGGRTVDYGIVRRVHYISITDTYTPLANRRAFFDTSHALPPSMCECYVQNEPVKTPAEFRTMLRSGMMGWFTLMCDPTQWTPAQHAMARRQFELYKARLRPLIRDGNLYHLTERPDGKRWDAVQYADATSRQAALLAFRGSTPETSQLFHLRGLKPTTRYQVAFEDGDVAPTTRTGAELMEQGLAVDLAEPGSSQLVFLTAVAR